jgi:hypothetical protein
MMLLIFQTAMVVARGVRAVWVQPNVLLSIMRADSSDECIPLFTKLRYDKFYATTRQAGTTWLNNAVGPIQTVNKG